MRKGLGDWGLGGWIAKWAGWCVLGWVAVCGGEAQKKKKAGSGVDWVAGGGGGRQKEKKK